MVGTRWNKRTVSSLRHISFHTKLMQSPKRSSAYSSNLVKCLERQTELCFQNIILILYSDAQNALLKTNLPGTKFCNALHDLTLFSSLPHSHVSIIPNHLNTLNHPLCLIPLAFEEMCPRCGRDGFGSRSTLYLENKERYPLTSQIQLALRRTCTLPILEAVLHGQNIDYSLECIYSVLPSRVIYKQLEKEKILFLIHLKVHRVQYQFIVGVQCLIN